jgi:acyl-CoA synthetase (AMP-forming)/AMP-acid ligase II
MRACNSHIKVNRVHQIYYSIAFLGIVAAGGVFAGTNPSYTTFELEHHIRTARIKFWIVDPDFIPIVQSTSAACGIPSSNIFAFDVLGQEVAAGFRSWKSLQIHGEVHWERFDDIERAKRTPIARLFSSGTTGMPKALDLSHYNFVGLYAPEAGFFFDLR